MNHKPQSENELSYHIRSAIFSVYNYLGPGLLESVYEIALNHGLISMGLDVRRQVVVPVRYKNILLESGFRIDLLVNDKVLIELKSVETLNPVHHKQILSYLKLTGLKLGLLVNFNTADISQNIIRKVNRL